MPTEHLLNNFNAVISTVNNQRPNRSGKFITRVFFTSPPSSEIFRIDPADFPFPDYERPESASAKPKKNEKVVVERTYQLFRNPV